MATAKPAIATRIKVQKKGNKPYFDRFQKEENSPLIVHSFAIEPDKRSAVEISPAKNIAEPKITFFMTIPFSLKVLYDCTSS